MSVVHDRDARTFRTAVDGNHATLDYELAGEVMTITHTRVPDEVSGHGIGGQLVRAALDSAREQGWKVIPACSFADVWMRRHPEYEELRAD